MNLLPAKTYCYHKRKISNKKLLISLLLVSLFSVVFTAHAQDNAKIDTSIPLVPEENAAQTPSNTMPQIPVGIIGANLAPANPANENDGNFYYEIKPGDTLEDSLWLANLRDEENALGIYAVYVLEQNGESKNYSLRTDESKEITEWIKIEQEPGINSINLSPKEKREIDFSINIPADTPMGTYFGGFALEKATPTNEIGIGNAFRKIIRIEIKVSDKTVGIKTAESAYYTYTYIALIIFVISLVYYLLSLKKAKKKNNNK